VSTYHLLSAAEGLPDPISQDELTRLYEHPDPGDRPWVRTNFVSTLDGAVQGPDGRAGTINTESDRLVFALQRAMSDVILVGAGTVRAEHYRAVDLDPWQRQLRAELGLQPHPTLAVVSRSCRLPEHISAVPGGEAGPVLILTTAASRSGRPEFHDQVEIVELTGDSAIPPSELITALTARGLRRVLCEGGPQLNHAMHAAGLVDEICLTFSPMIIGGDGSRTTAGPLIEPDQFRLAHCIAADDSSLLLRYVSAMSRQHT
jgi:riboflavin-specific deaminase-like protein